MRKDPTPKPWMIYGANGYPGSGGTPTRGRKTKPPWKRSLAPGASEAGPPGLRRCRRVASQSGYLNKHGAAALSP